MSIRKRPVPASSAMHLAELEADVAVKQAAFIATVEMITKWRRELDQLEIEADAAGELFDAAVAKALAAGWPKDKPLGLLPAGVA
jgi:hypothetical protein